MHGRISPIVVGLGQCSLDIIGRTGVYPELDQKAELDALLIQGGGPVATALVTLARLGVPVAMAGATGADDFGRRIRSGLLAEGVDCSALHRPAGSTSQVAFIAVDGEGHRNIFWHRGTAVPSPPRRLPASTRVLHLDGLHLAAALATARLARRRGVVTVLDAGTLRAGVEELLPLIDHLVVSEKFARQFHPGDPGEALARLAGFGAEAVTVTLGSAGSLSLVRGLLHRQPAFDVTVVDTTGCGDVFHGGYIYGLLEGWSLARTLRFAAACAALKARARGGRTGIPSLAEVDAFLSSRKES